MATSKEKVQRLKAISDYAEWCKTYAKFRPHKGDIVYNISKTPIGVVHHILFRDVTFTRPNGTLDTFWWVGPNGLNKYFSWRMPDGM